MTYPFRKALATALLSGSVIFTSVLPSWADNGLLTVIVPFSPGGSSDATARLVIARMAEHLDRKVMVQNKAGGGGTIAAMAAYSAEPDGSTIFLDGFHHMVNPYVFDNLGFDYADFVPFSLLAEFPMVLSASPRFEGKSIDALVAYAKENPGKVKIGNGGHASAGHLIVEQFTRAAGIEVVNVPYKGGRPTVTDTMAGVVEVGIATVPSSGPLLESGGTMGTPLGITSQTRLPGHPDIPTLAEQGFDSVTITEWAALFAPPGTPQEVLDEWYMALQTTLAEPEIQEHLTKLGGVVIGNSPAEFAAMVGTFGAEVEALVAEAGIGKE